MREIEYPVCQALTFTARHVAVEAVVAGQLGVLEVLA